MTKGVRNGLRISINTMSVSDENEGIRTMVIGLVPALVNNDRQNRYRLICSEANKTFFASLSGLVDLKVIHNDCRRPLIRVFCDQLMVPLLVERNTDILLTLTSVGSVLARVPQVPVLVAHLALPSVRKEAGIDRLSTLHRFYYGPLMRVSHRRAAAVITISDYLAHCLVVDTKVSPAKVHPILLGSNSHEACNNDHIGAPATPYILFVSTLYPYKNAGALIHAMSLALPDLAGGLTAIIVGRDPDGSEIGKLRKLAERLGISGSIQLTGRVDDDQLERFYDHATAVVFPSKAEGFGFGVLEAMARGIPVVTSDRTSLPEVVGDAAILVDPDDPKAIAGAIVEVVSNEDLRRRLVANGHLRASELSWDKTALAIIDLFGQISLRGRFTERRDR